MISHRLNDSNQTFRLDCSMISCTQFQVMVRKVHLSLRYFQDAVVKGTYELLPGCATVVLETILALQSYAMSRRDPRQV